MKENIRFSPLRGGEPGNDPKAKFVKFEPNRQVYLCEVHSVLHLPLDAPRWQQVAQVEGTIKSFIRLAAPEVNTCTPLSNR